jgi:hypothetical protein
MPPTPWHLTLQTTVQHGVGPVLFGGVFFSVGEMAKTFRGGKPWEHHGKTMGKPYAFRIDRVIGSFHILDYPNYFRSNIT